MGKLTKYEKEAKELLERLGWKVTKPHYPDFLVFSCSQVPSFCFVEVKRNQYDIVSKGQLDTARLFQLLGLPYYLFELDIAKDLENKKISTLPRPNTSFSILTPEKIKLLEDLAKRI